MEENRKEFASRYADSIKSYQAVSLSHFNARCLHIVRLLGCYPISVTKPAVQMPGANYNFEFKLFSWATFQSLIFSGTVCSLLAYTFFQFCCNDMLSDIFQEYYTEILGGRKADEVANLQNTSDANWITSQFSYRENVDLVSRLCLETVAQLIPVSALYFAYTAYASIPWYLKFLNGSNEFENQVRKLIPSEVLETTLGLLNVFSWEVFVLSCIVYLVFIGIQIPTYIFIFHSSRVFQFKLLLSLIVVDTVCVVGVIDDAKSVIMLKTMEEYFQLISDGIYIKPNKIAAFSSKKAYTLQDVRNWRSLVQLARKQAKFGFAAVQGSNSATLFLIQAVLTTSIFLVYNATFRTLPPFISRFSIGALAFCLLMYCRIYPKALVSENVTKKENRLAARLRLLEAELTPSTKLNEADAPTMTRMEVVDMQIMSLGNYLSRKLKPNVILCLPLITLQMSFVTEPIISKPTRCVLLNAVPLNISLLLGIFRTVTTYAVALIQLDSVHNILE